MAARSGGKVRSAPVDLEEVVREALCKAPGLKTTALKKALPVSHRAFANEATALARQLAMRGEFYSFQKGKGEFIFPGDPIARLSEIVSDRLEAGPLDKEALKQRVNEVAPGHAVAFEAWFKQALAQRKLFEHAAAPPSKKKRYGTEPGMLALAAVLTALRKALVKLDSQGVPRKRVAEALLEAVGVAAAAMPEPPHVQPMAPRSGPNGASDSSAHAEFVAALKTLAEENPRQALLSIRELRPRLALSREQFDAVALELMQGGAIHLHRHDHAAALSGSERAELVQDPRGYTYIGISVRRGP